MKDTSFYLLKLSIFTLRGGIIGFVLFDLYNANKIIIFVLIKEVKNGKSFCYYR